MRHSETYVALFKDDLKPSPERLEEMADALDRILDDYRPSPEGRSHAELFAPYYLRRYARDMRAWNTRTGETK